MIPPKTHISNLQLAAAGEFLTAAALSLRGWTCATFSHQIPIYDILAVAHNGATATFQSRAARTPSFVIPTITTYLDILYEHPKQSVRGPHPAPSPHLYTVFVSITPHTHPRFFVLSWPALTAHLQNAYTAFLTAHDNIRPLAPSSLRFALPLPDLLIHEDAWP